MDSIRYHGSTAKDDAAPFVSVYRLLIDNLIKAKRLEMALTLLEEVATLSLIGSNILTRGRKGKKWIKRL